MSEVADFDSRKPMPEGYERTDIDWDAIVTLIEAGAINHAEDFIARYIKSRFRSEVDYSMESESQPTWVTDRTVWVQGSVKREDLEEMLVGLVDDLVYETNNNVARRKEVLALVVRCILTDALRIRFGHAPEGWSVSVKVRYTYAPEPKL